MTTPQPGISKGTDLVVDCNFFTYGSKHMSFQCHMPRSWGSREQPAQQHSDSSKVSLSLRPSKFCALPFQICTSLPRRALPLNLLNGLKSKPNGAVLQKRMALPNSGYRVRSSQEKGTREISLLDLFAGASFANISWAARSTTN